MQNSINQSPDPDANIDEVNLKEIYNALLDSKKFIIYFILFFLIVGVTYSLLAPKIWTSSALLIISEDSGSSFNSSSMSGGLASLASFGMNNGTTQKTTQALAIMKSREFFEHLLKFDEVLPNLMAVKSFDLNRKKAIFDESVYDPTTKKWITSKPKNWLAYKVYQKIFSLQFKDDSGLVTISVSHRSPEFSQSFLDLIIRELNLLNRNRALRQSQDSLEYLYEELRTSQLNDVKLAISQLIETQLKTQMLARVKIDYSLETLDKPYYPNERSSPKRKQIVLFSFLLGVFFSIFLVLGRFFFNKNLY